MTEVRKTIADRITKNWKTTLVACLVFLVVVALVFLEKVTVSEASGWMFGAFTFLFSEDGLIQKKSTNVSKKDI